jgi:hypothetical protein
LAVAGIKSKPKPRGKNGGARKGAGSKGLVADKGKPPQLNNIAINQRMRIHVNRLFLEEAENALTTLTTIMSDKNEEAADRIKAAKEVLDRGIGKIIQTHELSGPGGQPIQHETREIADLSGMPKADLKQLETLLAKTVLAQYDKQPEMIDVEAEVIN